MTFNAKQFLIHQYLYNLQFGINCLNYISIQSKELSLKIHTPYVDLMHHYINIYAQPITKSAWATKNNDDYPLLLTDNSRLTESFQLSNPHFDIQALLAWQIESSFVFNNQIDIKSPKDIQKEFGIINPVNNWETICLTTHKNLYRQLCIYITFLLTAQDLYLYYYKGL